MKPNWYDEFHDSIWSGDGELWRDPDNNTGDKFDCTLAFRADGIQYSWIYKNQTETGSFEFVETGAIWSDSWHQPEPVECMAIQGAWSLFSVEYFYEVSSGPNWRWRSLLSKRPDGKIILQMVNVTPWGEEAQATKMVFVPLS